MAHTCRPNKQRIPSSLTALGLIKMASESENRDADSSSTSDAPYYNVQDFYTLSDKVSDSQNLTFLCKLCPPEKFAIIKLNLKIILGIDTYEVQFMARGSDG